MISIGQKQTLEVLRLTPPGAFLGDGADGEVLLPNRYVPTGMKVGDKIEVFVYTDSEDRPIATTREPLVMRNEFACLKVVDVTRFGAFMDWGLEKDLLVPFKQQSHRMNKGEWHLIYLYLDESTNRLVATSKLLPLFDKDLSVLEEGQMVEVLVGESVDLGIQAVINNRYRGLIYHNEIHQDLLIGERTTGYIKAIRPDGKLDISLQQTGIAHMEAGSQKILEVLREEGGFMEVTDKSDPEDIQFHFQLSKKAFKRSLGILYKQRRIIIEPEGIRLID